VSSFSCKDLYQVNRLKKILSRFDLHPKKSLGQHFLADRSYLESITSSTENTTSAVEIGSGMGSLTCALKEKFDEIIAIEIDKNFQEPFKQIVSSLKVKLVNKDFLYLDFSNLGLKPTRNATLIGNIPYSLTSKVIQKSLQDREFFRDIIITIQQEVANRVLAKPGSREIGPISFLAQGYARVEKVIDIPPDAFYPEPEVYSTTIKLSPWGKAKFTSDPELFFLVIRQLFNYRRKTIRKGLTINTELNLDKHTADKLLSTTSIDPKKRPEELKFEEFDRLATEIERIIST